MNTLVAGSNQSPRRGEDRSFLSYFNPFSYIVKDTPVEDIDPKSPIAGRSIVSVFGVPLGTQETPEDAPDVLNPPPAKSSDKGILDSLNPFSSKNP
jgi:hypothetical protein